ncbi:putative elongation factor SIII p15 subunit [Monocercomonoides exilis]|uniref:putative elongation factor SIII p15 subunit n=1 Tax=Monocercomonoides exilis TaxID=2049356 RepID=UPI0035599FA0|nr:putative elongation factor SIII p15 subunit [Monocercomonoides exilis]|eukprot:MONOS_1002.1-p1 / transcript=MONOS_1002.1 / gene=MONOS_1002 / organism=Monocercomonoides_exilis_PA203 / gene_product=elongation factor SIII p15 subunit, putative / transcript_product=elongation factor SIII p15 subunit, putative / location=Mono_scaffold00016:242646-243148(-) / protein_length=96 / sequence_SO=supercontig / SO=protein_coding / is_pseudo=false
MEDKLTLISSDGFEFIVDKNAAQVSGTIRTILQSEGFAESKGVITLSGITGEMLELAIKYFYYKLKWTNVSGEVPRFHIPPKDGLNLMMAAHYLQC